MSKQQRRRHDATTKARIAIEAIRETKPVHEIATEYSVHPAQINTWKKQLLEGGSTLFERGAPKNIEEMHVRETDNLKRIIGQLTAEKDFLLKKAKQLGL